nr:growth hormone receptor-like isoform X2 [Solea senegalensis]
MISSSSSSFFSFFFTALILESSSQEAADVPQRQPHLTGCVSTNMETFRCTWNVGSFRNLSEPGRLRLFFYNKKPPLTSPKEWSECPHYSAERPNECFFNENHTSIWTLYSVQLRSGDGNVLYDETFFFVQDIVQPEPPVDLQWTLLNASVTGTFYDIMLSWEPPESADVGTGWMTLQYEVQYRDLNSDQWTALDLVKSTQRSLFGFQTNIKYEVRVRCRMLSAEHFGEFSSSVFVHVPSKGSSFPVLGLLIFGALCFVAILMLVVIAQQEKLMLLLLPPVPGPKIRGIDPELLKKGKLRELTSILGAPPNLRPELYNSDPWVEFIDLDIEEQSDRLTELDTDCLVDRSPSTNCSPLSLGFRDDDSGRASCCDPDLHVDSEVSPFHPLILNQTLSRDPSCPEASEPHFPVQNPAAQAPGREALYTQVSEVRSSGKVLLSPEDQSEVQKPTSKDSEAEKLKEKRDLQQLLVENTDHRGYTSELNVVKMCPRLSTDNPSRPCQTSPSPHNDSYSTITSVSAPVYTVVEGVDRENSLVLTPNSTPAVHLIIPKDVPTPGGYLTPDLIGSVTP